MGVLWCLLIVLAILFSESEGHTDPCSSMVYSDIPDLGKRDPSYALDAVALCDRYLTPGWYRGGFHRMPTSPPDVTFCGTVYPLWLNGEHPQENTNSTVEVCRVGLSDTCSKKISIDVKNCGGYIVYHLQSLNLCNSAYCFEPNTKCVSEVPTNLAVSFHNVSWNEKVKGTRTTYLPRVNLNCSFTPLSNNSLFYDISWYVDTDEVVSGQTVDINSLDNAILSDADMKNKNKKAGSMIYCIVGAKKTVDGIVCNKTSSPLFFAGIKVLTPQLFIKKGRAANVELQFTIPYTTKMVYENNRIEDIFTTNLSVNSAVINSESKDCEDLNTKSCDLKVQGYPYRQNSTDDWKKVHTITVYASENGKFTVGDKHFTLRLETGGTSDDESKIFDTILLPDIQVYVNGSTNEWQGRKCGAYTDPHMLSFDGCTYECQLDGSFILYRNPNFSQEVQVKYHMCHPDYSYPRCTCAVAVRSGRDIFTVDICSGSTLINFPLCDDKVLKVIRKKDKRYQVLLPTGTLVDISLITWPTITTWQIDVVIYPSPSDVGRTRGLCGVLDGDINNDLTPRNSTTAIHCNPGSSPNIFSNSWR